MKLLGLWLTLAICLLLFMGSDGLDFGFGTGSKQKTKKGRDIQDIPNPKIDPVSCGRETVSHSSICDPDQLLTKDIKDEIEGYLNAMKEVEIAVVIINRMDRDGQTLKISDTEKKAEVFARTLHDTWGVGDKETQKGVLLFLSIYDRVIYFSTGKGVEAILSNEVIDALISGMRQYLKRGDYGVAIIHTLIEMDLLLTRKIKSTYGGSKTALKSHVNPSEMESSTETIIVVIIFIVFIGFGLTVNYFQNRKIQHYERGREQLEKLMKQVDNIKDNKYACTSCPICLEDFPAPYIPTTTATYPQQTTSTTTTTTEVEEVEREEDEESRNEENEVTTRTSLTETTTTTATTTTAIPEALPVDPSQNQEDRSSASTTSTSNPATDTSQQQQQHHERRPMALKCGHIFCRSCLEEYLSKPDGNKCPICRADIDDNNDQPPAGAASTANNNLPRSTTSTLRTRRNFFPFQNSRNIHTLWNYHSSDGYAGTGTGNTGYQQNYGSGTYTQTTFQQYAPELRYRLYRLHHYYPDAFTAEALRSMNSAIDRGAIDDIRSYVVNRGSELTRMVTEIREASKKSARNSGMGGSYSSSFSGGRSSGGRGGRW